MHIDSDVPFEAYAGLPHVMFVWVQFGTALPRSLAAYQLLVRFMVICLLDITKPANQ